MFHLSSLMVSVDGITFISADVAPLSLPKMVEMVISPMSRLSALLSKFTDVARRLFAALLLMFSWNGMPLFIIFTIERSHDSVSLGDVMAMVAFWYS